MARIDETERILENPIFQFGYRLIPERIEEKTNNGTRKGERFIVRLSFQMSVMIEFFGRSISRTINSTSGAAFTLSLEGDEPTSRSLRYLPDGLLEASLQKERLHLTSSLEKYLTSEINAFVSYLECCNIL